MKPENVPIEMVVVAAMAFAFVENEMTAEKFVATIRGRYLCGCMRHAIAAVAPLIAAAEREACAKVADAEYSDVGGWDYAPGDDYGRDRATAHREAAIEIAAAIRARGTND